MCGPGGLQAFASMTSRSGGIAVNRIEFMAEAAALTGRVASWGERVGAVVDDGVKLRAELDGLWSGLLPEVEAGIGLLRNAGAPVRSSDELLEGIQYAKEAGAMLGAKSSPRMVLRQTAGQVQHSITRPLVDILYDLGERERAVALEDALTAAFRWM